MGEAMEDVGGRSLHLAEKSRRETRARRTLEELEAEAGVGKSEALSGTSGNRSIPVTSGRGMNRTWLN
jgi:hypothetical protein